MWGYEETSNNMVEALKLGVMACDDAIEVDSLLEDFGHCAKSVGKIETDMAYEIWANGASLLPYHGKLETEANIAFGCITSAIINIDAGSSNFRDMINVVKPKLENIKDILLDIRSKQQMMVDTIQAINNDPNAGAYMALADSIEVMHDSMTRGIATIDTAVEELDDCYQNYDVTIDFEEK